MGRSAMAFVNKPQIKGETKLRSAVRNRTREINSWQINFQLSTINSQPSTALDERRIKREAKLAKFLLLTSDFFLAAVSSDTRNVKADSYIILLNSYFLVTFDRMK